MGIWTPVAEPAGFGPVGYGRFVFQKEKVTKWNCVFRKTIETAAGGIKFPIQEGEYSFQMFVIVGDLKTVHENMLALQKL
jgi:hypothetical protein